jgi:STE24 endopeptidase
VSGAHPAELAAGDASAHAFLPRRTQRALAIGAAMLAAAAWAWCAHELWHSSVPGGLRLPHVDVHSIFSATFLRRSASFDRFLEIDDLLAIVTLLAVLVAYARRGHELMRESAAGRIGTGILLGLLGFALVWLAQVPFAVAAAWWERRHHVSHQGYASAILESFLGFGSCFFCIALSPSIVMALAEKLRRGWWLTAAPLFAALALLSSFVSPYLIPNTHSLHDPVLAADARTLAAREGVPRSRVLVQTVSRSVTDPNAEAVGLGPTRRVVLWDTLLDGRFTHTQVRVVIAHELGHIAHGHLLTRVGWLLSFLLPATALVAVVTRRRGGLRRPEAVPLALLVFVALQLATLPLWALVSRHEEAEADWSALVATREPATARSLFEGLATASLGDPNPPTWSYVLFADHPTIAQRIAMTEAWQARVPGR